MNKQTHTNSIEQSLLESLSGYSSHEGEKMSLNGTFVFSPEFPGFQGHFPGQPILPAIIQLAAVRLLAALALDMPLVPVATGRTKFRSIVRPGESIKVTVNLRESENIWKAEFNISRKSETVATGNIDFVESTRWCPFGKHEQPKKGFSQNKRNTCSRPLPEPMAETMIKAVVKHGP